MPKTTDKNRSKKTSVKKNHFPRTDANNNNTKKKRNRAGLHAKRDNKQIQSPSKGESELKCKLPDRMEIIEFVLGAEYFGVDIRSVKEIIQMVEVTEVPDSPEFVKGIIDVRGTIVPLIDLRRMFVLEPRETDLDTEIIIAETEDKEIGLIVDRVFEIIVLERDHILAPDKKIVPLAKFLFGIAEVDQRLTLLLDLNKVLSHEERALVKKIKKPHLIIEQPVEKRSKEADTLHTRAVELSKRQVEEKIKKIQLITFSLSDEWYGLDVSHVREVSYVLDMYYIPSMPQHIIGTINVRGEIISVMDLKRFFELPETPLTTVSRIIIVNHNQINIGLLVDSVTDIVELPINVIEPPLATIEKITADYLRGEAEWHNRLIGLLDLENIVNLIIPANE